MWIYRSERFSFFNQAGTSVGIASAAQQDQRSSAWTVRLPRPCTFARNHNAWIARPRSQVDRSTFRRYICRTTGCSRSAGTSSPETSQGSRRTLRRRLKLNAQVSRGPRRGKDRRGSAYTVRLRCRLRAGVVWSVQVSENQRSKAITETPFVLTTPCDRGQVHMRQV